MGAISIRQFLAKKIFDEKITSLGKISKAISCNEKSYSKEYIHKVLHGEKVPKNTLFYERIAAFFNADPYNFIEYKKAVLFEYAKKAKDNELDPVIAEIRRQTRLKKTNGA